MIFLRSRLKTELWIPAEPGRNSRWPVGISVCNSTHWYPHQTWALRRNCTSSWEHAVHLIPGALPWIIPENRQRPNHDPTGRLEKLKGKHFHFCFVCFSWGRFILLALSRALAPSLPVSINLFFPPVSVHSLNINICRTDVAMDASWGFSILLRGLLKGVLHLCSRQMETLSINPLLTEWRLLSCLSWEVVRWSNRLRRLRPFVSLCCRLSVTLIPKEVWLPVIS